MSCLSVCSVVGCLIYFFNSCCLQDLSAQLSDSSRTSKGSVDIKQLQTQLDEKTRVIPSSVYCLFNYVLMAM